MGLWLRVLVEILGSVISFPFHITLFIRYILLSLFHCSLKLVYEMFYYCFYFIVIELCDPVSLYYLLYAFVALFL